MADRNVERLGRAHERGSFCCGEPTLDEFLRALVGQYEKRRLGRTYVAVRGVEKQVGGYYTLAAGSIVLQDLPATVARKLPRHPVPTALLARLAVDRSAQGQGLGETLLVDALDRCRRSAEELAIYAVEVVAVGEAAGAFYRKYGFVPLLDDPLHLYLPMATIEQAFRNR